MSVPMGGAEDGLPIGLQIIGPRHGDLAVLRAAAAGELFAEGERVVRRAYRPAAGELVVETEPAG